MIMFILSSPVLRVSWSKQTEITERWVPGPSQCDSGSSLHAGRARGWDAVRWNTRGKEQGLHFRSQHQFSAVSCGSPWTAQAAVTRGQLVGEQQPQLPCVPTTSRPSPDCLIKTGCRGQKASILDILSPQKWEQSVFCSWVCSQPGLILHQGGVLASPLWGGVLLLWSRRVQQPEVASLWPAVPPPSWLTAIFSFSPCFVFLLLSIFFVCITPSLYAFNNQISFPD